MPKNKQIVALLADIWIINSFMNHEPEMIINELSLKEVFSCPSDEKLEFALQPSFHS